jgi:hypothetical protein
VIGIEEGSHSVLGGLGSAKTLLDLGEAQMLAVVLGIGI